VREQCSLREFRAGGSPRCQRGAARFASTQSGKGWSPAGGVPTRGEFPALDASGSTSTTARSRRRASQARAAPPTPASGGAASRTGLSWVCVGGSPDKPGDSARATIRTRCVHALDVMSTRETPCVVWAFFVWWGHALAPRSMPCPREEPGCAWQRDGGSCSPPGVTVGGRRPIKQDALQPAIDCAYQGAGVAASQGDHATPRYQEPLRRATNGLLPQQASMRRVRQPPSIW
jgi:hypothetical protein